MPKQLNRTDYKCVYCGKTFQLETDAINHEENDHDIVFIQLERSDLNRLALFIATGDTGLLTERLVKAIMSYAGSK